MKRGVTYQRGQRSFKKAKGLKPYKTKKEEKMANALQGREKMAKEVKSDQRGKGLQQEEGGSKSLKAGQDSKS